MSAQNLSSIPVTKSDLAAQMKGANDLIKSVSWEVEASLDKTGTSAYSKTAARSDVSISIEGLISGINADDHLPSDIEIHILRTIRCGVQIGRHIAEDYYNRSGVPDTSSSNLTSEQKTEINEKKQTAAAIALFVMSRFIIRETQVLVEANAFIGNLNINLAEVEMQSLVPALRCATYYLGHNIECLADADEQRLIAVVYEFAQVLQQDILNRSGSFKHLEFFTSLVYQVEDSDFTVAGFEKMSLSQNLSEIKEVYPEDVIGNDTASDGVAVNMRKLFLYDPETRINPIKAFGGFQSVQLLSGNPGNGKTLIMSMARTLGRDYAEASGLPYRDLVVPNMVSKMQGESTDLAKEYLRQLVDPSTINLGIGDELEVFLPDHGGDSVSEGDKKVAVEFLKTLSGVGTVDYLNFIFLGATNYPESVDKAFMSRVKEKHYIEGATTIDDYVRFLILNLRKLNKLYPQLINIRNVNWERDLRVKSPVDPSYLRWDPTMSVTNLHDSVLEHHSPEDIMFFASFFYLMKKRQSTFSLRDCDNTIGSAKAHVSGFEVPLEFITERQHYIDQEMRHKEGLISDLAAQHVKNSGIDFATMMREKAVYYAEEALRMADTRRQRAIEKRVEQMLVDRMALDALNNQMGIAK